MEKIYEIVCQHCKKPTGFDVEDCPKLDSFIDAERSNAEHEALDDYEGDHDECLDLSSLRSDRLLMKLSSAIARGDCTDAAVHLDRLADEAGTRAQEEVAQGRAMNPAFAA